MTNTQNTLVHHFLEKSAESYPDKVAVIADDSRLTYHEVNARARQLASWLIDQGIDKGDRVVILLMNSPEYIVSYYGSMMAGAVPVALSTGITAEGLSPILDELEPFICITAKRFEPVFKGIDLSAHHVQKLIIQDPGEAWPGIEAHDWSDLVGGSIVPPVKIDVSSHDLASIIYTSGSTGTPKGVMLTHKNIVTNVSSICEYLQLTDKDIQMVVLPFFYVMGKSLLNTHFAVGGTVVLNNRFAFTASMIKGVI